MLIWQATSPTNHNSYLLFGDTMLHQTPKNCGALDQGKRSPQKKAAVTTFKGARLLKWLVAYCVLHCASATSETMPTCGCAVEIAALQKDNDAKFDALEVARAAENEAIHQKFDQKLQAVYTFVGMTPPSAPPSPPPSTPPSPPPPSPPPPPPSPPPSPPCSPLPPPSPA